MKTSDTNENQPKKNKVRLYCIVACLCVVIIAGGYFLVRALTDKDTSSRQPADSGTPSETVSSEISSITATTEVFDSKELPQNVTTGASETVTDSDADTFPAESEANAAVSDSEAEGIVPSENNNIQQTEPFVPATAPATVQDVTPDTPAPTNADTYTGDNSSDATTYSLSDNIDYIEIPETIGRPFSDFFN